MYQARATEKDLEWLENLANAINEAVEDAEDMEEAIGEAVVEHGFRPASINRIINGYRIMFQYACDPDLDYLDWKPELKALGVESAKD